MLSCLKIFSLLLLFIVSFSTSKITVKAYGTNPGGNITIKWDLIFWTPDGYVTVVTIYNFQKHRSIQAPGWELGWTWAHKEVIWSTLGGQATNQGDCSKFKENIPVSCMKSPTIVDLNPNVPYTQQIGNCCRGGVLAAWSGRAQARALSSFQLTIGQAGHSKRTVKLPKNFTFKAPGGGYRCGPAKIVRSTRFVTPDGRRTTQALMTWNVTCLYSSIRRSLAQDQVF